MSLQRRPDGMTDDTVAALGRLSEALEWIERARGRLYDFHQMSGHADLLVGEAVEAMRDAGHDDAADLLERELVGRNVIEGRWTFQVVEEYDDTYWSVARDLEARVRRDLGDPPRHIHEAEMKADRITPGHPHHRPSPPIATADPEQSDGTHDQQSVAARGEASDVARSHGLAPPDGSS